MRGIRHRSDEAPFSGIGSGRLSGKRKFNASEDRTVGQVSSGGPGLGSISRNASLSPCCPHPSTVRSVLSTTVKNKNLCIEFTKCYCYADENLYTDTIISPEINMDTIISNSDFRSRFVRSFTFMEADTCRSSPTTMDCCPLPLQ